MCRLNDGKMCGPFRQLSVWWCSQLGAITKVKRKRREFSLWKLSLYHSGLQMGKCLPSMNILQGKAISYHCDREDPSLFLLRMMKKDTQDYLWYIRLRWKCQSALFISRLFRTSCRLTTHCTKWHSSVWLWCSQCDCKFPVQRLLSIPPLHLGLNPGSSSPWLWDLGKFLDLDEFSVLICKMGINTNTRNL